TLGCEVHRPRQRLTLRLLLAALAIPLRVVLADLVGHAGRYVVGATRNIMAITAGGFALAGAARMLGAIVEGFFATFLLLHAASHCDCRLIAADGGPSGRKAHLRRSCSEANAQAGHSAGKLN